MRTPLLPPLLTLALGVVLLTGCKATPGNAAPAAAPTAPTGTAAAQPATAASPRPAAASAPTPGCDADFSAFNITKDTFLSYDEYVDGRYGQVRFIKAPTEAEEIAMKDGFRQEARAADTNGDNRLSLEEFRTTCR
jgi:hypothetical protein